MLDTIELDVIKKYVDTIPLAGVTSTPSIIHREGKIDFFRHMKETRQIIGKERSLHMQVVSKNYQGMVQDAITLWEKIDSEVYAKIPATLDGIKAIQYLKKQGACHITASATYSKMQGNLAIEAGADYLAVYTNRVENINGDSVDMIRSFRQLIDRENQKTKVMASSIKNVAQINNAIDAGADAATFAVSILEDAFNMASINQAVNDFTADWVELYGVESINY